MAVTRERLTRALAPKVVAVIGDNRPADTTGCAR